MEPRLAEKKTFQTNSFFRPIQGHSILYRPYRPLLEPLQQEKKLEIGP